MILLDTHALVWLVAQPKRLSAAARSAIASSTDGLAIADITLWELAVLFQRGHLGGLGTVEASVRLLTESAGASVRPITSELAALAAQFPDDYPCDPADRLIGATALTEGMALVTRDEGIRASKLVKTIW